MAPLAGNLESVYSLYNLANQETTGQQGEPLKRDAANPKFTNYSVDF